MPLAAERASALTVAACQFFPEIPGADLLHFYQVRHVYELGRAGGDQLPLDGQNQVVGLQCKERNLHLAPICACCTATPARTVRGLQQADGSDVS
jgi:hypothetical protein